MRRASIVMAVLAFTVVLGPSAGAVVPGAAEFQMWCDFDRNGSRETYFVATGNHRPGWVDPWNPGDSLSGGIFMGGTQTFTSPEGSFSWTMAPPRGLSSRLTDCRAELEADGSSYVADPAWIFFPPGAAWA